MRWKVGYLSPGDLWIFPEGENERLYDLCRSHPTIRQSFAELVVDGEFVLKKIRYQKFADHLRKTFRSQAKREALSARALAELGIRTPRIYGYGFNLSPVGPYESVLLMEYFPNIGTLREVFREEPDPSVREILLKKLGRDLQRMVEARIYHKDAHLGNILVTPDYDLIWIDNDLAPIKGPDESKRLLKKFRATPLLDEEEKSAFLPDHLPG
ncbi:MAG TPA: hypothetical protein ENJ74_01490 [Nitratifractor salsuginis]|uniref:Uncharacterized protein n=1 Tax=Nitratifractor salsuginis TaxID=269261 RepID=A0A7V2WLQ1_9BACT|nr:hypothetical protein [Nitratifractor salsuginis]